MVLAAAVSSNEISNQLAICVSFVSLKERLVYTSLSIMSTYFLQYFLYCSFDGFTRHDVLIDLFFVKVYLDLLLI